MFSLAKMSPASEWYYLTLVNYYLGKRSRKKTKKKPGSRPGGDDDSPDEGPDSDEPGFGDVDPYTINTPGEPPGRWFGLGAAILGLSGIVLEEHYHPVFRGFHPFTGQLLVQNAGMPDRRPGWEACFTPPKYVQVFWSQLQGDDRDAVQDCNWRAAEDSLRFIESYLAFSRAGKASLGCEYVPVGLVVAMFEHASSRAKDPNLHIHAQIFNLGITDRAISRALDPSLIFKLQKLMTAYYRAKLAANLRARFGLLTPATKTGFRVEGIPEELVKTYSKRRQQILDHMAEHQETGGKAAARAALLTRQRKDPLVSRQELFDEWRKTNAAAGFDDSRVAELIKHGPRQPSGTFRQVIKQAVADLTRQKNHFARQELLLQVLRTLPDHGLDPDPLFDELETYLAKSPHIVPLGISEGQEHYSTRRILREEYRMLAAVGQLHNRPGIQVADRTLEKVLKKRPTMQQEQVDYVRHLTRGQGAFRIGLGLAGSGKTYALKACYDAWKREGYRVLVAAPTGQAARVLGQSIGTEGQTLAKLLGDYRIPLSRFLVHHARQLYAAAHHWETYRLRQPRPAEITPDTIVLVDEAGMIDTRTMRKLGEVVSRGGGTLCLIGDPSQLPAVEGTAPLHSLAECFDPPMLTQNRRQREEADRVIARKFAEGKVGEALSISALRNNITVRDDLQEAVQQACLDWTAEGLLTPKRAIILTNTNTLADSANDLCQEHRIRAGCLRTDLSLEITDEQDDDVYVARVHVHDRVLFTRNSRGRNGYGVDNGSLGTVAAIEPATLEISVALDDGRYVVVKPADFPHIRLGYAATTHHGQGATIPGKVYAIVGGDLQNLPASYVQATRAVEETKFYTTKDLLRPDLENIEDSPLARQMSRRPDLRLAMDFLVDAPVDLRTWALRRFKPSTMTPAPKALPAPDRLALPCPAALESPALPPPPAPVTTATVMQLPSVPVAVATLDHQAATLAIPPLNYGMQQSDWVCRVVQPTASPQAATQNPSPPANSNGRVRSAVQPSPPSWTSTIIVSQASSPQLTSPAPAQNPSSSIRVPVRVRQSGPDDRQREKDRRERQQQERRRKRTRRRNERKAQQRRKLRALREREEALRREALEVQRREREEALRREAQEAQRRERRETAKREQEKPQSPRRLCDLTPRELQIWWIQTRYEFLIQQEQDKMRAEAFRRLAEIRENLANPPDRPSFWSILFGSSDSPSSTPSRQCSSPSGSSQ